MAENTKGVNVPLSADVRKALSDLQQVINLARQARAETSGLPAPNATGRPSMHPLVAPMPGAQIPGGRAHGMLTPVVVSTEAAESPVQKAANERGAKFVYGSSEVLRGTGNAATRMVQSPGMPNAGVPAVTAAGAASQGAFAAQEERLARTIMEGPKMTSGGPKLGPIGMGAMGGGLTGAFTKTLGPAAGYAAVAHIGLKTLEGATGFMADAVARAAETGRDVDAVVMEKVVSALHELPGQVASGVIGALDGPAKTVLNIAGAAGAIAKGGGVLGLAARVLMPLSSVMALSDDPRLLTDAAKGKIDDLMAYLNGTPDRGQQQRNANAESDRAMEGLRAKAQEMVAKNQQRVAEQLVHGGFPGTFDQMKDNPHVVAALSELANEAAHEEALRIQREHSKATNGKQE